MTEDYSVVTDSRAEQFILERLDKIVELLEKIANSVENIPVD